jgi:hypothetical protein
MLGVMVSGCASARAPREEIATAELAVREARQSKAPQHANLELRLATEKLNGARRAMAEEDYVAARRLAEQALADAQLAEAKAQSAEAKRMAGQLREAIQTLSSELRGAAGS